MKHLRQQMTITDLKINKGGSVEHSQFTMEFLEAFKDEITIVRKEIGLNDRYFVIDTLHKTSNGCFSEISIGTDVKFVMRLDWDALPALLSCDQKFRIAALEAMENIHSISEVKSYEVDAYLPEHRCIFSRPYIQGLVTAYSGGLRYHHMRFGELIIPGYMESLR